MGPSICSTAESTKEVGRRRGSFDKEAAESRSRHSRIGRVSRRRDLPTVPTWNQTESTRARRRRCEWGRDSGDGWRGGGGRTSGDRRVGRERGGGSDGESGTGPLEVMTPVGGLPVPGTSAGGRGLGVGDNSGSGMSRRRLRWKGIRGTDAPGARSREVVGGVCVGTGAAAGGGCVVGSGGGRPE